VAHRDPRDDAEADRLIRLERACAERCNPGMRAVHALGLACFAALLVAGATNAGNPSSKLRGNNFYANCRFSHTSNDDPIVYPGEPGRSHHHTFFGNRSTDAYSTPASLRDGRTTCKPRADKGAYWVPTLYQDGREVRPSKGQFYYNLRSYTDMHPFPAGLKMVAGDQHAHHPQPLRVTYWACGGGAGVRVHKGAAVPATCPVVRRNFKAFVKRCPTCPVERRTYPARIQTYLELHVDFPDCWDGKRLDTPDHQSHMAYSSNYVCPGSHPVKVPLIRALIRYPITSGLNVELASGGQLTGHADFVNAWDQRAFAKLVDDCFHMRPCNEPRRRR
jgi:hypothetical protein